LAIAKRIAGLLGCEVSVASQPGRGSRFSVTIARAPEQALGEFDATAELSGTQAEDITGALIVVIDDERDIRDALEGLLTGWGAFVVTAASQREAIEKLELEERLPDLLICDLRLDHADGIRVIKALRQHLQTEVSAVLVSGDTSPQRVTEANAAGLAMAHKPLNAQKLRTLIAQALRAPDAQSDA
jgi:CheY-like chemotaxis protein